MEMLGLLCAIREGMEAGEGLGNGGSRVEKGSRNKVKKDIRSMVVEREKGYRKEGGVVTGHGNVEQWAG